jgi:hypothetical protein
MRDIKMRKKVFVVIISISLVACSSVDYKGLDDTQTRLKSNYEHEVNSCRNLITATIDKQATSDREKLIALTALVAASSGIGGIMIAISQANTAAAAVTGFSGSVFAVVQGFYKPGAFNNPDAEVARREQFRKEVEKTIAEWDGTMPDSDKEKVISSLKSLCLVAPLS